jgi:hypothetical protein
MKKFLSKDQKITLVVLVANSVLLAASIWFSMQGSLEMVPNEEQEEKASLAWGLLATIFSIIELGLLTAFIVSFFKKNHLD